MLERPEGTGIRYGAGKPESQDHISVQERKQPREPLRAYDVSSEDFDRDREIERISRRARLFWERESRTLDWFGLRDGMRILELGSGPGYYTELLLTKYPSSHVTGIEVDAELSSSARARLTKEALTRFTALRADLETDDLGGGFDCAIARLIFQHLADPLQVVRKVFRSLNPGGRLVVTDVDADLLAIVTPMTPALRDLQRAQETLMHRKGTDRAIGRKLWRLLKAGGFADLDLELICAHSDASSIDAFAHELDPVTWERLVAVGALSAPQFESALQARRELLESDPFLLIALLMVTGVKPR